MKIADNIVDVITGATVVAGLVWTVFNFGIQRVRRPVIRLHVEKTHVSREQGYASVLLRVSASNSGKTGVSQDMCWAEIIPLAGLNASPDDVLASQPRVTRDTRRYSLFKLHTYLEPGEEFQDGLLLHVPHDTKFFLVRVIFSANRPNKTWYCQVGVGITA